MTLLPSRPILDVPVRFDDEQRLLALALTYPDVADVVLDAKVLRPTDFYHDQHTRIFTAMRALHSAGQPLNLATVPLELRRRGWEDEAGYVFDALSSAVHFSYGSEDVAGWIKALQQRRKAGELQDLQRDAISAVRSGDPQKMKAAYAALVEGVSDTPTTPNGYTLYNYSSLITLPPQRWLYEGEIPENGLSMLVGPSRGGKSFVMTDRALRVALAHPDQAVIYIAPEGGTGYRKRIDAWCQHHGVEPPKNLYFILDTVPLLDEAKRSLFLSSLGSLKPVLIVVDTLARSMIGGDENSTKDMGLMIDACDQLRHATGAAVQLVHHTGKNGSGYRGSSALFGACDVVTELANDDGLITLSCGKSKDSAEFEPYCLRMVAVGESCVLLPAERVLLRGDVLTQRQRKTLEAMALEVFEHAGAKAVDLIDMLGIPRRSLYNTLSTLLRGGYITQADKGDPYYITSKGRTAVTPDVCQVCNGTTDGTPVEAVAQPDCIAENDTDSAQDEVLVQATIPHQDAQVQGVPTVCNDVQGTGCASVPGVPHSFRSGTGTHIAQQETDSYDPIAACDAALDRRSWIAARPHLDEVPEGKERERLEARYQAVKASWKRSDGPLFE